LARDRSKALVHRLDADRFVVRLLVERRELGVTAHALFIAGRYAEAATWAEKAFREQPNLLPTIRLMAATNALSGRLEEAHKAITCGRALDPGMRISNLTDRVGPFHPEDFARYAEALRLAGLPE
jgi:hypothetical protein